MAYGDLPEDGVPVVGHDDAAHGVHEHLEHGLGAEAGADDVADLDGGVDVLLLDALPGVALRVLRQHQHRARPALLGSHHHVEKL